MGQDIRRIIDTEHAYSCILSTAQTRTPYGYRYDDDLLTDMYCHNTLRVSTPGLCITDEIIAEEAAYRKGRGQTVVQVECFETEGVHFSDDVDRKAMESQIVMAAGIGELSIHPKRDCRIERAATDGLFSIGKQVDITGFGEGMEDFVRRRYDRKQIAYQDDSCPIDNYICFDGDLPVGNCDLTIIGDSAKIEDLDILKTYQNRGYGTSFLAGLISICGRSQVKYVHLIVDEDNPRARYLYEKIGLKPLMWNRMYRKEID